MSKGYYIIPIFVPHEGCPHDCAFCNQHSITGNQDENLEAEVRGVIQEYLMSINHNKDKEAVVEISFFGGTFTGININKQNLLLSIAKEYKDRGDISNIRLSTRPDYINEDILNNLLRYDVDVIELGAQSFHNEVLKGATRGHSADDIRLASKQIKEFGFQLGIQLMLGLPNANYERDFYSAQETLKVKPDFVRLYPALVIKNTAMETMFYEGEYRPYTLDQCIDITKKIYALFEVNDIKVIRIGLQPTKEIALGAELVEGPFHPSIRELVEGAIMNDVLLESIIDLKQDVVVGINKRDISKLYADKKKFFLKTQMEFSGNIKVDQCSNVLRNELTIFSGETQGHIRIKDFLRRMYL